LARNTIGDGHKWSDAGVVETTAELEYSRKIVFFSWTGFDEADQIAGNGSADAA
jgi:hypothetical protein